MTFFEVLVVIVCLFVVAVLLLPTLAAAKRHSGPVNCVANLQLIGLSFHIWQGDNNNLFPMSVPVANEGAMELVETGNVAGCFQVVSNELSTPKTLVCPMDTGRTFATNWDALDGSHISYFLSLDPSNSADPGKVLVGDDNLTIGGLNVKSGRIDSPSNSLISWAPTRHGGMYRWPYFWSSLRTNRGGNICFADGSVGQESLPALQQAFQGTGLTTNRFAIP